jgi:hypothetical protein
MKVYSSCPRCHSGENAHAGDPTKATITNKTRTAGSFPPASQAGRLAGPVFYISFLWKEWLGQWLRDGEDEVNLSDLLPWTN